MKDLAAGRPADISTAEAGCYLAIARHVSSTFGEAVPLATTGQAFDVLKPGGGGGAKLAAEREKLDRELLAALLDFAHGRVAWDTPVATRTDVGRVTFGTLVKLADQARAGTSVDRVMTLRQALGAV
jgi:hypothetical protein